jgi:hypothetical protein
MSDTPTFANLFTQWTSGDPAARAGVYVHLRNDPAAAEAIEEFVRDELDSALAWRRVIAAEAMVEVYHDEPAAATALAWVLRRGEPAASNAMAVLCKLAPERAGPLLTDFVIHAPDVFRALPAAVHRSAGSIAACAGAEWWLVLLGHAGADAESAFLMGLADAAPRVTSDLSAVEPAVRSRLFHTGPGYAAGAALWRLTWRVHRDWLASINPHSPRFEGDALLLVFLIEVLTEHLGRRPDLAALVRELVVRLGTDDAAAFRDVAARLADLGGRGWSVLLPILGDDAVPAETRAFVFSAAVRPEVLPLAHHHAHGVVLARDNNRAAVPPELLAAAGEVLRALGAAAGSAMPDILNLIVKQPDTARTVAPVLPALAPGCPLPAAAVARTLDRLRRSVVFAPDGFAALAEVYAQLNRDGWQRLVEDTSFDPRTADALLQQPAWKDARTDVRRKHALALADRLASPRPEVRARAADLLRHYPDQMPVVWPALVALLAGGDERAVLLAVPNFRHLASVANAVTPELTALFREPNPTFAARAVVALWRLGRMPVVAADLRAAVVTAADGAWGWAVLRGVVDRVFQAHGLLHDLSAVFAAAPQEVAAKVHALLNPPELPEEQAISAHVKTEPDPAGAPPVNWDGVYQCVGSDPEGGLLFLALMCAHGSVGFVSQKIWMIKHQRSLAGTGLAEAKTIVERAIERLTPTATAMDRNVCVRDYFGNAHFGLPKVLTDLLEHRLSWYRWAGLELLDAWGAPEQVPALIEDRVWDRSALVRTRALRMHHG